MDVMTALVFSFMAGLGMVFSECDTLAIVVDKMFGTSRTSS